MKRKVPVALFEKSRLETAGYQILACRFGVVMLPIRAHKYVVGLHPKVTFLSDSCTKSELRQLVRCFVSPQVIFEFADFEVPFRIGLGMLFARDRLRIDTWVVHW